MRYTSLLPLSPQTSEWSELAELVHSLAERLVSELGEGWSVGRVHTEADALTIAIDGDDLYVWLSIDASDDLAPPNPLPIHVECGARDRNRTMLPTFATNGMSAALILVGAATWCYVGAAVGVATGVTLFFAALWFSARWQKSKRVAPNIAKDVIAAVTATLTRQLPDSSCL